MTRADRWFVAMLAMFIVFMLIDTDSHPLNAWLTFFNMLLAGGLFLWHNRQKP
jgi:hypothetical protein